MGTLRFTANLTVLTWKKLCQRRGLLAGLVLLCLLLPLGAGRAAQQLFSQGVDFSGVTLALTAPAGDQTPDLLARYLGDMEDVAQYCRFTALPEEEALDALRAGEITAVLALPPNFLNGVMSGTNPDLRLIVRGDQPLESLLLLWVGQSAGDILAAFQSGVYAVLEQYEKSPPPGLSRDQVVLDVNLDYIQLTLDRSRLFQTETVSAAALPLPVHYTLALLAFFALSAAPLFVPVCGGDWLAFQHRLRGAGRGSEYGCVCGILAGTGVLFLLLAPGLLALGGGNFFPAQLAAAALMALWCALFWAACCLLAPTASLCGTAALSLALAGLALAGGIVPPLFLPAGMRAFSWLSPVTWLMELAAWPLGYGASLRSLACLGLSGTGMALLCLILYGKRMEQGTRT